ncbi:UDP-N-acetylmuramoyl-tripeptide--D-alanyl-D-alanine ligase [Streptomyces vinaceus]|uniref:UDP-N-acetylmuramoyl-tripeptide--D-alanyl-D- alanine ligase n=1 Tax=Streptomyces vinaceus TaxID=1960 RepID=UPI0035DDAF90
MIPFSVQETASACGGQLAGAADPNRLITGPLAFDSRDISPGSLFCCLRGASRDGHDFAARAIEAGAAAVLADRAVDAPAIVVPDVIAAMGHIAKHVASAYTGTVIALTGSAGKTSTKDLLKAILEPEGSTVATHRSFNNEIGFPVTVSRVQSSSRYLILEMGSRGLGHISSLCQIARPTIATVLGVGSAHIGEFGSRQVTARAKAEIIRALPAHGTAVLNGDDPLVAAMAGDTDAKVITFGFGEDCDVRAEQIDMQRDGRPRFVLAHGASKRRIALRVHGRHNVVNALAAAATAIAAHVPVARVAQALRDAEISSGGRMEVTTRPDGVTVINDAFNAGPESMLAALTALGDIAGPHRRRVTVLGEMTELGREATDWHDQVTDHLIRIRPAAVMGLGGDHIDRVLAGLTAAGLAAAKATGEKPLVEQITNLLRPGDVVLLKGANTFGLEAVARTLAGVSVT